VITDQYKCISKPYWAEANWKSYLRCFVDNAIVEPPLTKERAFWTEVSTNPRLDRMKEHTG
jgi:hypothetical protein